ncbi:RDD family protein [Bacillus sp. S/N-304-OC-R1]|uniref:RDD family protein n=1 Tax=Bacillus sp. S/N-304-OC-R1 TaxID=2758034 RepID=UPI001C8D5113|nr:RDD family protein [Bacillus sp. S/N-304-OC-R1]MBY0120895.1 RDD family protein [Bacillus sp. S/N-304-OC-R1]
METILEKQPYEERKEYGGFWIRFAAYLIDSIIIGLPLSIITIIIFMIFFGTSGALELLLADPSATDISDEQAFLFLGSYLGALGLSFLINIVGAVAYFAGLHSSKWQATVGKRLLGLKVTDLKGDRISFWRALGRYLAMSFLSGILLIGYIIAAFTEKKQSLHDLIAGTIVIKK